MHVPGKLLSHDQRKAVLGIYMLQGLFKRFCKAHLDIFYKCLMFVFFIATGGMIKHEFNLRKHLTSLGLNLLHPNCSILKSEIVVYNR